MNEIKISIVIPVYNVKDYLNRCVNSIINQDYKNLEIILVDDGSSDGSSELCDSIAQKDSRIIVIHQNNGGLSVARNTGIKASTGEYLMLIDSDDFIDDNCILSIVKDIESSDCDIWVGAAKVINEENKIIGEKGNFWKVDAQSFGSVQYLKMLDKNRCCVSFCAQYMVYRLDFVKENNLLFYPGILHEDELWTPNILIKASRIFWSGLLFYFHFIRTGSIMHSHNYEKRGNDICIVCEELMKLFSEKKVTYLEDRMVMIYLSAAQYMVNTKEYRDRLGRFFCVKYAHHPRTIIKAILFAMNTKAYIKLASRAHT